MRKIHPMAGRKPAGAARFAGGLLIAALLPALWTPLASAGPVYRCDGAGGIRFTDEPDAPSCRRLHLPEVRPDPEALARLERDRERWAREAREAAERDRAERLLRVREREAEAVLRSARAAELQALAASRCPWDGAPPVYYAIPAYPAMPPIYALPPGFLSGAGHSRSRFTDSAWDTLSIDFGFSVPAR
jgi:hypothetical protein